jgi:hypothetical protein
VFRTCRHNTLKLIQKHVTSITRSTQLPPLSTVTAQLKPNSALVAVSTGRAPLPCGHLGLHTLECGTGLASDDFYVRGSLVVATGKKVNSSESGFSRSFNRDNNFYNAWTRSFRKVLENYEISISPKRVNVRPIYKTRIISHDYRVLIFGICLNDQTWKVH